MFTEKIFWRLQRLDDTRRKAEILKRFLTKAIWTKIFRMDNIYGRLGECLTNSMPFHALKIRTNLLNQHDTNILQHHLLVNILTSGTTDVIHNFVSLPAASATPDKLYALHEKKQYRYIVSSTMATLFMLAQHMCCQNRQCRSQQPWR